MDVESLRSAKSDRSARYAAMPTAGSPRRAGSGGPPSRPPPPPPAEDRESDPADGSSAVGAAPPPRAGTHGHQRAHRSRDQHHRTPAEPDDVPLSEYVCCL